MFETVRKIKTVRNSGSNSYEIKNLNNLMQTIY